MKWEEYYEKFYDMSKERKVKGAQTLTDFGSNEEIMELAFELAELGALDILINNALDNGVLFSYDDIEELIYFDDKKLNSRLIFDNLDTLKENLAIDEFDFLEMYMNKQDFINLMNGINSDSAIYEDSQKVGLATKVGGGLLGAKILGRIFGDND